MRPTTAPEGLRVFVYRNLTRQCWSVKALEGPERGRVVAHIDPMQPGQGLALRDVRFKVSEAGRQRVLRERRKNVHAGVVGRVADGAYPPLWDSQRVTYNPYAGPHFVHHCTDEPAHTAMFAEFTVGGVRAWEVA